MYCEMSCSVPVILCCAIYRQILSRLARASSLFASALLISSRTRLRIGALSSRPSSYPQAFSAAAIRNTGSLLTSERGGPAGSTSEGAFSWTGCDDELCRAAGGLLLEDCAAAARATEATRTKMATGGTNASLVNGLYGIKGTLP